MPLKIVRNDITAMKVDAIVNSAHPTPIVGGGVDRAIHDRAGTALLAARQKIGDIHTGEAFLTPAFHLPAKYVIHTVGPVWQDGTHGERTLLAACYQNALHLALEHACASIAFPLISAGVFGCPAEIAIRAATTAIRAFLAEHEMEVYLVIFDRSAFQISRHLFDDVQRYVDKTYTEETEAEERQSEPPLRRKEPLRGVFRGAVLRPQPTKEMSFQRMDVPHRKKTLGGKIKEALAPLHRPFHESMEEARAASPQPSRKKNRTLSDLIAEIDDTFSEALIRLIDKKGKTDPEIYKRANIDRRHFSKIRNTPDYQPKKATALAFAIALELNLDETKDFIGRAGYALSHSSKMDIIVEYFIKREEYDIFTINETLFAFEQPCLG